MAPNPFVLIKHAFCPHKWGRRSPGASRSSSTSSANVQEHRDAPVPGIYEYRPGRGWYLIEYDCPPEIESSDSSTKSNTSELPRSVTYCKLLHRWMFTSEYNSRRHFDLVKNDKNVVEEIGFFRLDDGVTYIQCWDGQGKWCIQQKSTHKRWCIDAKTRQMREMRYSDAVIDGEERQSRRDSWERGMRHMSVHDVSSVSSTPRTASRRPKYETRGSASTVASSAQTQATGTAITTPSSGVLSRGVTSEELDAKRLHSELLKIRREPTPYPSVEGKGKEKARDS